jgi:hypothetical protein
MGHSPRAQVKGVRDALAQRSIETGQAPKQANVAAGIGGAR